LGELTQAGHHAEYCFTYVATRTRDGRVKGERESMGSKLSRLLVLFHLTKGRSAPCDDRKPKSELKHNTANSRPALGQIYKSFSEGFDTADLVRAKRKLDNA
jgi:hypothetical protein